MDRQRRGNAAAAPDPTVGATGSPPAAAAWRGGRLRGPRRVRLGAAQRRFFVPFVSPSLFRASRAPMPLTARMAARVVLLTRRGPVALSHP